MLHEIHEHTGHWAHLLRPLVERPGHAYVEAQRQAAERFRRNDIRRKALRTRHSVALVATPIEVIEFSLDDDEHDQAEEEN